MHPRRRTIIQRQRRTIDLHQHGATHVMTNHIQRQEPTIDRDWYAWLIDPLPTAEFERDYYEQRLCSHSAQERRA